MKKMKETNLKLLRNLGFGIMTALLIALIVIAILTYTHRDAHYSNPIIMFAITNHFAIMIGLVIVSIAFGFIWSNMSYVQIKKSKDDSVGVLDVMMLFLSKEEKDIISFLVKNNGETTQAEISRISNMGRVKAFRSLARMQEKNVITIEAHGKVRKIRLKENIMHILSKK
jgi:uncharacterized membrane protein